MLALLYGALHLSSVQTWLVKRVADNLSNRLHTRVSVGSVDIAFFDKIKINDLLIEDRGKDTLLYAGIAKININDWFFLGNDIDLKYLGLEQGLIRLQRDDSTWNYQFLLDALRPAPQQPQKGPSTQFHLGRLDLKKIRIEQKDRWLGQDQLLSLIDMSLAVEKFDANKKLIHISSLNLTGPQMSQRTYSGKKSDNYPTGVKNNASQQISSLQWNPDRWNISIDRLQISDGRLRVDKLTERAAYVDRFDGLHFDFSKIEANLKDISIKDDSIRMQLNIQADEKSGFQLKKLQANLLVTPDLMEFNQLDLRTNKSRIGNYYAMHYRSFIRDMNAFLSNVQIEGRFQETEVDIEDLAYFAPGLKSLKRKFKFSGNGKGTIQDMQVSNLMLETGNTKLDASARLRGMESFSGFQIDLSARDLQTDIQEISSLSPSLKDIKGISLPALGKIRFAGDFHRDASYVSASGTLQTGVGSLDAQLFLNTPDKAPTQYHGKIFTTGINIGQLTGNEQLGMISFNGNISGEGLDEKHMNAEIDGKIGTLHFNKYDFNDITVKGTLGPDFFDGEFSINDSKIKINQLAGRMAFGKNGLALDLSADLKSVNLKALELSKKELELSGLFKLNFTGSNIDDFLGNAQLYSAQLTSGNKILPIHSLNLSSSILNGEKSLSLHTEAIDADIKGEFKILELPKAFTVFLSKYYPSYIHPPTGNISHQHLRFNVQTHDLEQLVDMLHPDWQGFSYASIDGDLNLDSNSIHIKASIPDFTYGNKQIRGFELSALGNRDSLATQAAVDDISISDSFHFPNTQLNFTSSNDVSKIHLNTSASEALNQAELNAELTTQPNGISILFAPSSFIINNKRWELADKGALSISKNEFKAENILLREGYQEISLNSTTGSSGTVVAEIKKLIIEDFAPYMAQDPNVRGLLTGKAEITDPFGNFGFKFNGVADSFDINQNKIGQLELSARSDEPSGVIEFAASSQNEKNDFKINGNYSLQDTSSNPLLLYITGKKIDLAILQPYLTGIFSNISGIASSELKISGDKKNNWLTGEVMIDSANLEVAFTKCLYKVKNELLTFKKDEIVLPIIRLKDSLGNKGSLSGVIKHHFFKDFSFNNIRFETGKMLLLHTDKRDNSQFYGKIIGSASMSLNGPINNMKMFINGQPDTEDSSHVYISAADSKENENIDYIDFVSIGSQYKETEFKNNTANLVTELNIKATPACKVDVILDEATGDVIKGAGSGSISIKVGNIEPLTVRGKYELERGEYNFNFQTFVQKPFTLKSGTVSWVGNPTEADIDISAEYLAKNVDISNIVSTGGFNQKEDIIINSHLTGKLSQPEIHFEFKLSDKSELQRDVIAVRKLKELQNDENEMNKQVASLLLFNTFITEQQNFFSGQNTLAFTASTVGGILSNWLTNLFNKELEKATNGMLSTYIDINPSLSLQKNANELQANVRAGLKLLLSNRIKVLVGGNLEYNNPYIPLQRKQLLTPDITLEWLLNKEGSIRVVGFHRSSLDLAVGQRNRSGGQLMYRKDFYKLGDIFKSRKKRQS